MEISHDVDGHDPIAETLAFLYKEREDIDAGIKVLERLAGIPHKESGNDTPPIEPPKAKRTWSRRKKVETKPPAKNLETADNDNADNESGGTKAEMKTTCSMSDIAQFLSGYEEPITPFAMRDILEDSWNIKVTEGDIKNLLLKMRDRVMVEQPEPGKWKLTKQGQRYAVQTSQEKG